MNPLSRTLLILQELGIFPAAKGIVELSVIIMNTVLHALASSMGLSQFYCARSIRAVERVRDLIIPLERKPQDEPTLSRAH